MSHLRLILRVLVVSSVIALAVYGGLAFFSDHESFFQNILTESIGILLTVTLIDFLIRRNEERQKAPVVYAACAELRVFCARSASLWHSVLRSTLNVVEDRQLLEAIGKNQFDARLFEQISRLDFSQPAPVTPARDWGVYMCEDVVRLSREAGNCINRYSNFISPRCILLLQQIESSMFFNIVQLLPTIRQTWPTIGVDGRTIANFRLDGDTIATFLIPLSKLWLEVNSLQANIKGKVKDVEPIDELEDFFIKSYLEASVKT